MVGPKQILDSALQRALDHLSAPIIADSDQLQRVELIARNLQNRANVRFLMACLLAKSHRPEIDIRKPYTEIGDRDSYAGRSYDEQYIEAFVIEHRLPCNPTTAFLTPAFRNRNIILTPDVNLVGRPPAVYQATLQLLTDIDERKAAAEDLLAEVIRCLIVFRNEGEQRIETLLANLQRSEDRFPLSAEAIITLIEQHLASRGSSRLPVLIVAAAYETASDYLGEQVLPLTGHHAADKQTQALGDVQIALAGDSNIVTAYEMKTRRVTRNDIDKALLKISEAPYAIGNYIFVTTDVITDEVKNYAAHLYEQTGGIEIVVLDCIAFLRHFLHLFHRIRMQFLDAYQARVLSEPDSSVSQPLKEVFLALRQVAESRE